MINTYHTSLPPPPVPPRTGMHHAASGRTSPPVWFFSAVLVVQMVLTMGGFVYLFRKNSMMQNEFLGRSYDDFIVLKRLQECDDGSLDSNSLLDCRKILDKFMAVISKISQAGAVGKGALLSGSMPFRVSSPVAHMVPERQPPTSKTVMWNRDHSLLAKVTYLSGPGALKILQPGNYYVYSQVTFTNMSATHPLAHSIVRTRTSGEKTDILLRAYASVKSKDQPPGATSFQGGVFKLEKDEQLFLNVTDVKSLTLDETSTTFGLFML
ncbi:hypothetical protein ANANG_G00069260 [Anguilla anguilla]|uniref:THD domain-containing protein n=1 Tax=Anguilla anguilla TaxID=7936 RepID=A0A9D3MQE1_ANGAN|nr:hypothetical protein ANANG_G00069260 [Anguilla anguilla]